MKREIASASFIAARMANAALAAPPLETGVSRELARWRTKSYGDVRYDLALTLRPPVTKLEGRLELRVAVRGKPVELVLEVRSQLLVIALRIAFDARARKRRCERVHHDDEQSSTIVSPGFRLEYVC